MTMRGTVKRLNQPFLGTWFTAASSAKKSAKSTVCVEEYAMGKEYANVPAMEE